MFPPHAVEAVVSWRHGEIYAQCDSCLELEMFEASKVRVAYSTPGRVIVETPEFMVAKTKLGLPGNDTRKR